MLKTCLNLIQLKNIKILTFLKLVKHINYHYFYISLTNSFNDPSLCISLRISLPPMNFPFIYS